MFEEQSQRLREASERLAELIGALRLDDTRTKIADIEQKMTVAGFWNDPESAQKVVQEIGENAVANHCDTSDESQVKAAVEATIAAFDGLRRFRVLPPLALWPVGLTGCRPPLVRPSPPPCGWSIGFMAVPRTWGRMPFQRLRPALPTTIAS